MNKKQKFRVRRGQFEQQLEQHWQSHVQRPSTATFMVMAD